MSKSSIPQSCIYIILNTKNGKVYIGKAKDYKYRWEQHKSKLRGGYHTNRHLQSAWNLYGEKAFRFQVLEYCDSDDLVSREKHHIAIYKARGLAYNLTDGGEGTAGLVISAERRQRLREVNLGKHHDLSEEVKHRVRERLKGNTFRLGIKHTEETKRKIGQASKGRTHPMSEETRRKISEANKGRKHSAEARQKMSKSRKGRVLSEEHRHKIGEANKGRVQSEETRQKISNAAKLRYLRKKDDNE